MFCRTKLFSTLVNVRKTGAGVDLISCFRVFFPNYNARTLSKCSSGNDCPKMRVCKMEQHPDNKKQANENKNTENITKKAKYEYKFCRPTAPCKTGLVDSCEPKQAPLIYTWTTSKECCNDPCPDAPPRFDALFWTPSNKHTREYQQTWVECPRIKIRPRKVCCFDEIRMPPLCRREKHEIHTSEESACAFDANKLKSCLKKEKSKCPRLRMPCCREARIPPICKRKKKRQPCEIPCCPYPSFSECCKPCPPPSRPVECKCTDVPSLCEVLQYFKRKQQYNLPPPINVVKWS